MSRRKRIRLTTNTAIEIDHVGLGFRLVDVVMYWTWSCTGRSHVLGELRGQWLSIKVSVCGQASSNRAASSHDVVNLPDDVHILINLGIESDEHDPFLKVEVAQQVPHKCARVRQVVQSRGMFDQLTLCVCNDGLGLGSMSFQSVSDDLGIARRYSRNHRVHSGCSLLVF